MSIRRDPVRLIGTPWRAAIAPGFAGLALLAPSLRRLRSGSPGTSRCGTSGADRRHHPGLVFLLLRRLLLLRTTILLCPTSNLVWIQARITNRLLTALRTLLRTALRTGILCRALTTLGIGATGALLRTTLLTRRLARLPAGLLSRSCLGTARGFATSAGLRSAPDGSTEPVQQGLPVSPGQKF